MDSKLKYLNLILLKMVFYLNDCIVGFVQVIPSQGMPKYEREEVRGNLFVLYTVALPDPLTTDQKTAIQDLF